MKMEKRRTESSSSAKMYPRVRVKIQDASNIDDEEEAGSLWTALDNLYLQEGFDHHNDSSPVARIPKDYVPFLPPSPSSTFKGKSNKESCENKKSTIKAPSILPPRAILSSPDNDEVISHRRRVVARVCAAKHKKETQQGKSNSRNGKEMETPCTTTKISSKNTSTSHAKETAVPRHTNYLRKGKTRTNFT